MITCEGYKNGKYQLIEHDRNVLLNFTGPDAAKYQQVNPPAADDPHVQSVEFSLPESYVETIFCCSDCGKPLHIEADRHDTVPVTIPTFTIGETETIQVDKKIAPLIKALNEAGIHTFMSCQESEPGVAWIAFFHPSHLEKFLSLAVRSFNVASWPVTISVDSYTSEGKKYAWLDTTVRFPAKHIRKVTKLIEAEGAK